MSTRIIILNGPNLNMLGTREPEIYGHKTLADIEAECRALASSLDIEIEAKQSNHEGELIDWIQQARDHASGIIINAGALTHTSIGIRDALALCGLPVIEVHISNIHKRESFRQMSLIAGVASGSIVGLGTDGYLRAIESMKSLLS